CPIDPRAADVPEVLYTFDSFDHDTHIKVIRALRTSIPESIEKRSLWLRRFHSDDTHEEVFQGEISMTYFNLLNLVDGYALKLEFLAADENSRADKERQFCEFIRSAVIMD
ncbi:MAG TPA: hypothetical protein PK585_08630, partial [Amphiplicatus sp.]|nr:hypothetical protein [Amphiplicatus sp.]